MSNSAQTTVCVTGAGGYIGSHVTRELLERGYRVRGTVRDARDDSKCAHLRGLPGASERLELFSADLLEPDSFDEPISGCRHVYHVASAVYLAAKDAQRQIVDVAVEGTNNVLSSIAKADSVERVGLTSSIAAISSNRPRPGYTFTEEDWNEDATVKNNPYALSKTLSERAVWKFRESLPEGRRLGLCVVNPVFVIGPVYAKVHLRTSPSVVLDVLTGTFRGCPPLSFALVDVRDVATALVSGTENPEIDGRYILHHKSLWMKQMADIVSPAYPELKVPTRRIPGFAVYAAALFDKRISFGFARRMVGRMDAISNEKATRELGVQFRPVEQSILDTCESFFEGGYLSRPEKTSS